MPYLPEISLALGLLESPLLLASGWMNRMWYALPLIAVISLVYAATRHEMMKPILDHATRFGLWVFTFMVVVFGVLMLVTSWL